MDWGKEEEEKGEEEHGQGAGGMEREGGGGGGRREMRSEWKRRRRRNASRWTGSLGAEGRSHGVDVPQRERTCEGGGAGGGGGRGYLREGERVGHRADQDLAQFAVQVRTLDAVQVGVDPEDPGKTAGSTDALARQPAQPAPLRDFARPPTDLRVS